ncbi:MAG: 1-deoxy-D-xylulose-5-phosphate synthase [Actinomycetales bacterium]|nr:1-deoxy-D-xylulose-5-phosphate synthase [Actinomycetales bacterium]
MEGYPLLRGIDGPQDLRHLSRAELGDLATEIRRFLVEKVSRTGGHLGPNLGVVELTIALHRVFNSPSDVLIWDTGHQSYVHKMLTGRAADFGTLRQPGGLSGYPSRSESLHDVVENSHASTALSYADGIAKAFALQGQRGRSVVAVVGDGALTGGMSWEALNNIAAREDLPLVIVVNDNERSYSPTIGGLAHHLATLRTTWGYDGFLKWGKEILERTPVVGRPVFEALHGMKKGIKDVVAPQGMFEDLGLKYLGPVDGHNIDEVEHLLARAKAYRGPVIVHCITEKGRGHAPAEQDHAERFHAVAVSDPVTGAPVSAPAPNWTGVFSDAMVALGRSRDDIVAITAAMQGPTGLDAFARKFPDRTFDVGIAEQHATTSAAGLAYAGLHPVVAIYSTFLNRAFDQVLMDCALHNAGVTFVLDRAGVTGDDGPSHHGMWDLALLQAVPGLRIAAPRDGQRLVELLEEASQVRHCPTVLRFPKGALPAPVDAVASVGGVDVLFGSAEAEVVIVAVGAMAGLAMAAAAELTQAGVRAAVVDPRWVKPVPGALIDLCRQAARVVVVEDGLRDGGVGSAVANAVADAGLHTPVSRIGLPTSFLAHGPRAKVLQDAGVTVAAIVDAAMQVRAHL